MRVQIGCKRGRSKVGSNGGGGEGGGRERKERGGGGDKVDVQSERRERVVRLCRPCGCLVVALLRGSLLRLLLSLVCR